MESSVKSVRILLLFALSFSVSEAVFANAYTCAKMVYKDGWLKKYDYLGNTWGENTKKHGMVSSSIGSSGEKTTAIFDPGVTTGQWMSSMQYSSSWGECAMVEMYITQQFREDYIDQNMDELKKQIALGKGHHVDALAFLSGCTEVEQSQWTHKLQSGTAEFYDINKANEFSQKIDQMIHSDSHLNQHCKLPADVG